MRRDYKDIRGYIYGKANQKEKRIHFDNKGLCMVK